MQIPCSKKGCKKHDKCSKMEPKWKSKSRTNRQKTRSGNRCEKRGACPDPPGGSAAWAGAPLRLNHRRPVLSLARLLSSLARLPLRFRLNLHHTTFSNVFLRLLPAKAYLFYVSSRLLRSCDVISHSNFLRALLRLM